MHADEFLKEVLDSPLCPENFEIIYREFQHYQQLAMNTLNELHRVCEKNGIPYQLAYGSLLGAIRDDGMIPWDYDVDVWVPYCEVPALISALQKDLSDDYYFCCHQLDPKWDHFMMRLAPKGYRTEVLHVDVFYMIGVPNKEEDRLKFVQQALQLYHKRIKKLIDVKENYGGRIMPQVKLYLRKLQYSVVTVDELDKQFDYIANKYPIKEAELCMSVCGTIGRRYKRDELWDTKLITLPSGTFRITKNYDYFLHHMFGDYKRFFPLKDRLDEMMKHYHSLRKRARKM